MAQWRSSASLSSFNVWTLCATLAHITDQVDAFNDFGPNCDNLERLPGTVALPQSLRGGDYILISGIVAYSKVICTTFNGFGAFSVKQLPTG